MTRKANSLLSRINGLNKWVMAGTIIVVAIVGIWSAGYGASAFLDTRYTLAKDTEEHIQNDARQFAGTKLLFLENRQGQLEEQQFRLKVEKERRPLNGLERERLDKIDKDLKRLDKQIEQEQKKANPPPH